MKVYNSFFKYTKENNIIIHTAKHPYIHVPQISASPSNVFNPTLIGQVAEFLHIYAWTDSVYVANKTYNIKNLEPITWKELTFLFDRENFWIVYDYSVVICQLEKLVKSNDYHRIGVSAIHRINKPKYFEVSEDFLLNTLVNRAYIAQTKTQGLYLNIPKLNL